MLQETNPAIKNSTLYKQFKTDEEYWEFIRNSEPTKSLLKIEEIMYKIQSMKKEIQDRIDVVKEDVSGIPDHGEQCWTTGSETFTRQEVAYLLHTQRSMMGNDLKRYCGDKLTKEMFDIIDNPRKPEW